MAKDIEEFLKMAAARRKAAQAQGQAAQAPPPAQTPPTPPPQTPARPPQATPPAARKPRPQVGKPVVAGKQIEVVARRESVAEHVKSHISTQRIAEHTAALGQEVGLADDKLEARLQRTFDHDVGSLATAGTAVAGKPADRSESASALRQLLASKLAIRQAVVLGEVLKRPDW